MPYHLDEHDDQHQQEKEGESSGAIRDRLVALGGPVGDPQTIEEALQHLSDAWLTHKATAEKGFSLGRFERAYLLNCARPGKVGKTSRQRAVVVKD